MIYFDTDLLIHYLIEQDQEKHSLAIQLFDKTTEKGLFFISLLSLQEAAFVLYELKIDPHTIDRMVDRLLPYAYIGYNLKQFLRAKELTAKIGYQNINDCLHTAIAEDNCKELYTFNRSDFKRIENFTTLKIRIL